MRTLKVYQLQNLMSDYSFFLEKNCDYLDDSISIKAIRQKWMPFDLDRFTPPEFGLEQSDAGKKNYEFDISSATAPFFIFSEKTLEAIRDILEPRGQILPIITPSKRKKYIGYYPTNPLIDSIDLEKSKQMDIDPMKNFGITDISELYIKKGIVLDEYIICPELGKSCVLVTDKFRERVEQAGLLGFDFTFSYEIKLL